VQRRPVEVVDAVHVRTARLQHVTEHLSIYALAVQKRHWWRSASSHTSTRYKSY